MRASVTDSGQAWQTDQTSSRRSRKAVIASSLIQNVTRLIDISEGNFTYRKISTAVSRGSTKMEDRRDTVADFPDAARSSGS